MFFWDCDYCEGADERILARLIETNRESLPGYGSDRYCESAKEKIRIACASADADVFFLTGGTQTNMTVISSLLSSYEGVLTAASGHIAVHEAGAIENRGHKVLELPQHDGKILPEELRAFLVSFHKNETKEHMVYPGLVYLSHPTEFGTLYTAAELSDLSLICREYEIPLYLDGARLGYGLAAAGTDVTLPVLAKFCDVFYIGGTKVGALCGEAVVFPRGNAPRHFFTRIKQQGALLAKGRLVGIQFDTLFTDDLYLELGKHAIRMAEKLRDGLKKKGFTFYLSSPTNQQFLVVTRAELARIASLTTYSFWENLDEEHKVIRLATSWATKETDIDTFLAEI